MKNVYFLRPVGADGPIKIGCSKEPTHRLRSVEIWSPLKLEIVATAPGDSREEGILHQMFGDQRRHGEWFDLTPALAELMDYVVKTGQLPPLDYSLCVYAQKRKDPKARSKMTRRTDPVIYREKWSITTSISNAERRVYGYRGYDFYRPNEIQEIIDGYRGFGAPVPNEEQMKAIEHYVARLREMPAADRSMDAWLDWHKMLTVPESIAA